MPFEVTANLFYGCDTHTCQLNEKLMSIAYMVVPHSLGGSTDNYVAISMLQGSEMVLPL